MQNYFIADHELKKFVESLMKKHAVIAPVANRSRFSFEKLSLAEELRLDYDTTILPPKTVFFPTKQDLIHFDSQGFHACINPEVTVLLGVHPHDIKGIALSDKFYEDRNEDNNYMANRKATIIIGTNVHNHYKYAFFGSINKNMPVSGHDAFLTRIEGGYVFEMISKKSDHLVAQSDFPKATDVQLKAAAEVNQKTAENCPQEITGSPEAINKKVRENYNSPIWEEMAKDCFSCGSCNIVCPTCYCFDVQDEWNIDGKSGTRSRLWDACLTREFSEVSVQGGTENFRENRNERYRHRFMRKMSYLTELLGGPACIGCGRCSGACTADIANPTTVINKIMES